MSVQINQYLMYGVQLDAEKLDDDFYDKYESFMDDSAYKSTVNEKDGIFCLYDGMSGNYAIVGKVLQKSSDENLIDGPIEIDYLLSKKQKSEVKESIGRNFYELLPHEWACSYIFVTNYR